MVILSILQKHLASFYEKMKCYKNIFKSCGLQTVAVEADSGAIGGASSKDLWLLQIQEDSILFTESGSYAEILKKLFLYPLSYSFRK